MPRRSFGAWIAKRSDALSANLEGMISRGRANWQNLRTKPLSQDEFYQGAQGRWTRGMDWLRSYRARRAEPESTEEAEEPQASEPTNRRNGLVAAGAALTLTALVGTGLYLSRDKYTAPVQPTAPPAVTQTAPKQAPPAPAKPKEQTAPQIQQEAPVQPTRISGYQVDPSFLALTPEQRAETIERIGRRGGYWEVAKVIFSNARNNPKDYIIALGNMNDVDVMAEDVAQERKYMPRYAGNGIRDWFSAEEMTSLAQKVNAALAPQAPGAAPASTYLRLGSDSPHTEIASEGVVHAGGDSTLDARVGSSVQRAATPAWMVNGGIERQLAQLYGFKAQQGSRMDARTLFGQYKDIVLPELRSLSGRERFAAGGALHNLCQRVVAEYKRNEAIETYRAVLSSGYEGSAIRRTAELLGESYSTIAKRTRELRA